jgi:hypothetical protein
VANEKGSETFYVSNRETARRICANNDPFLLPHPKSGFTKYSYRKITASVYREGDDVQTLINKMV